MCLHRKCSREKLNQGPQRYNYVIIGDLTLLIACNLGLVQSRVTMVIDPDIFNGSQHRSAHEESLVLWYCVN